MHRIPKLKDQARIVREAYQSKGTPMEVAESLELVARLNGFSDWNAAAAAAKTEGRSAAPKGAEYELSLKVWTILHEHKFGTTVYTTTERPSEEDAIEIINREGGPYEPERDESIEITGPDRLKVKARLSGNKAVPVSTPFPGVAGTNVGCFEVNLSDEFDEAEALPEQRWISANCSFEHRENNVDGISEQMVRVNLALQDPQLPPRLAPFFKKAKAIGCKWVLFFQL